MNMMPKRDPRGHRVYKSDTNRMGVLQLLCSTVREWIKGGPSFCSVLSVLLYSSCFTTGVVCMYNKCPHV